MRFYNFCLSVIIILSSKTILASGDSLLAKIGTSGITTVEFQQRFELIPQINSGVKRGLDEKKRDLLHSLIAEKLWALEATELRIDTSDIMQITFKTIEKMFVRDALYKIEITDKVKISSEEKLEGLKKTYFNLELELLQFSDSLSALRIHQMLKRGISFDSAKVITQSFLPAIQIKYGELKESIENMLYNLNTKEFTSPIKSSSGWLIFRLLKKEPALIENRNQALLIVEKIIKQRKIEKYYDEFYGKFFSSKRVETDGALFWSISDKITHLLSEKKFSNSITDSESVYLDAEDLLSIEKQLGSDTLNMKFIKLDESPITVNQFLREFFFDGFYSANVKPNVIASKMNSRVKTFIEQELLAREGYKRGLQNLPEVKTSISMWRDNYLAKILKNILIDSIKVSDAELYEYYSKRNAIADSSLMEVNILEILTDSLDVVESVMRELEKGTDFRALASLHTKRVWTKNNGGEFGFFPVMLYGDIGRTAATMNIGEIYGPIKLPEGYSIFKLIDKKDLEIDSTLTFEQAKEEIRRDLAYKKSADFFIDYTVKLANKFGVEINEQIFNSISVSDQNMFVYRYMGFGGRINAMPMAIPFNEWFLPWEERKKQIP